MEYDWRDLLPLLSALRPGTPTFDAFSQTLLSKVEKDELPAFFHVLICGVALSEAETPTALFSLLEIVCSSYAGDLLPLLKRDGAISLIMVEDMDLERVLLANSLDEIIPMDTASSMISSEALYSQKWMEKQRKRLKNILTSTSSSKVEKAAFKYLDAHMGLDQQDFFHIEKLQSESPHIDGSVSKTNALMRLVGVSDGIYEVESWFVRLLRHLIVNLLEQRSERRQLAAMVLRSMVVGLNCGLNGSEVSYLPLYLANDLFSIGLVMLILDDSMEFDSTGVTRSSESDFGYHLSSFPVKAEVAKLVVSALASIAKVDSTCAAGGFNKLLRITTCENKPKGQYGSLLSLYRYLLQSSLSAEKESLLCTLRSTLPAVASACKSTLDYLRSIATEFLCLMISLIPPNVITPSDNCTVSLLVLTVEDYLECLYDQHKICLLSTDPDDILHIVPRLGEALKLLTEVVIQDPKLIMTKRPLLKWLLCYFSMIESVWTLDLSSAENSFPLLIKLCETSLDIISKVGSAIGTLSKNDCISCSSLAIAELIADIRVKCVDHLSAVLCLSTCHLLPKTEPITDLSLAISLEEQSRYLHWDTIASRTIDCIKVLNAITALEDAGEENASTDICVLFLKTVKESLLWDHSIQQHPFHRLWNKFCRHSDLHSVSQLPPQILILLVLKSPIWITLLSSHILVSCTGAITFVDTTMQLLKDIYQSSAVPGDVLKTGNGDTGSDTSMVVVFGAKKQKKKRPRFTIEGLSSNNSSAKVEESDSVALPLKRTRVEGRLQSANSQGFGEDARARLQCAAFTLLYLNLLTISPGTLHTSRTIVQNLRLSISKKLEQLISSDSPATGKQDRFQLISSQMLPMLLSLLSYPSISANTVDNAYHYNQRVVLANFLQQSSHAMGDHEPSSNEFSIIHALLIAGCQYLVVRLSIQSITSPEETISVAVSPNLAPTLVSATASATASVSLREPSPEDHLRQCIEIFFSTLEEKGSHSLWYNLPLILQFLAKSSIAFTAALLVYFRSLLTTTYHSYTCSQTFMCLIDVLSASDLAHALWLPSNQSTIEDNLHPSVGITHPWHRSLTVLCDDSSGTSLSLSPKQLAIVVGKVVRYLNTVSLAKPASFPDSVSAVQGMNTSLHGNVVDDLLSDTAQYLVHQLFALYTSSSIHVHSYGHINSTETSSGGMTGSNFHGSSNRRSRAYWAQCVLAIAQEVSQEIAVCAFDAWMLLAIQGLGDNTVQDSSGMAGGTQDGVEVRSILLQVFRLLVPLAPLGLSQKHTLSSARNQNIAHGNRSSGLQLKALLAKSSPRSFLDNRDPYDVELRALLVQYLVQARETTVAPTPIPTTENSDDPIRARLARAARAYQWEGVQWWTALRRCGLGGILADDMGLGKSLQALLCLGVLRCDERLSHEPLDPSPSSPHSSCPSSSMMTYGKVLIICPASLTRHWAAEIDKHFCSNRQSRGNVRITSDTHAETIEEEGVEDKLFRHVIFDPKQFDPASLHATSSEMVDVVIVSYDLFRRHSAPFESTKNSIGKDSKSTSSSKNHTTAFSFASIAWQCVVLDEAHILRNPQSQVTQRLGQLRTRYRLALTGTPIQNHLQDLWSLFHVLVPQYLGSYPSFRVKFARPVEKCWKAIKWLQQEQQQVQRRQKKPVTSERDQQENRLNTKQEHDDGVETGNRENDSEGPEDSRMRVEEDSDFEDHNDTGRHVHNQANTKTSRDDAQSQPHLQIKSNIRNKHLQLSTEGLSRLHHLHTLVLPFILRRTKEEVLPELPPKTLVDLLCPLRPPQRTMYRDFQERLLRRWQYTPDVRSSRQTTETHQHSVSNAHGRAAVLNVGSKEESEVESDVEESINLFERTVYAEDASSSLSTTELQQSMTTPDEDDDDDALFTLHFAPPSNQSSTTNATGMNNHGNNAGSSATTLHPLAALTCLTLLCVHPALVIDAHLHPAYRRQLLHTSTTIFASGKLLRLVKLLNELGILVDEDDGADEEMLEGVHGGLLGKGRQRRENTIHSKHRNNGAHNGVRPIKTSPLTRRTQHIYSQASPSLIATSSGGRQPVIGTVPSGYASFAAFLHAVDSALDEPSDGDPHDGNNPRGTSSDSKQDDGTSANKSLYHEGDEVDSEEVEAEEGSMHYDSSDTSSGSEEENEEDNEVEKESAHAKDTDNHNINKENNEDIDNDYHKTNTNGNTKSSSRLRKCLIFVQHTATLDLLEATLCAPLGLEPYVLPSRPRTKQPDASDGTNTNKNHQNNNSSTHANATQSARVLRSSTVGSALAGAPGSGTSGSGGRKRKTLQYARLDGGMSPGLRYDVARAFNRSCETGMYASDEKEYDEESDRLCLLLLTTRSCGLGLNLTAADSVIFVEHDWNPFVDLQAMDRVHRLGQTRAVRVFRLLAQSTVEDRVLSLQRFKQSVSQHVLTGNNTTDNSDSADKSSANANTKDTGTNAINIMEYLQSLETQSHGRKGEGDYHRWGQLLWESLTSNENLR